MSDMSAEACVKALVFSWISHFGVPETITSDRGMQFTSNIWSKPLSQTVQSKDSTTASRMLFTHMPPRRLGPRSYLLYSWVSVHSRGKTLLFPWMRQFLVLQLSCPMNFCKEINFLLMKLSKNYIKNFRCSCFSLAQA